MAGLPWDAISERLARSKVGVKSAHWRVDWWPAGSLLISHLPAKRFLGKPLLWFWFCPNFLPSRTGCIFIWNRKLKFYLIYFSLISFSNCSQRSPPVAQFVPQAQTRHEGGLPERSHQNCAPCIFLPSVFFPQSNTQTSQPHARHLKPSHGREPLRHVSKATREPIGNPIGNQFAFCRERIQNDNMSASNIFRKYWHVNPKVLAFILCITKTFTLFYIKPLCYINI